MAKSSTLQTNKERSTTYSHLSEVQKVQLIYMVDRQKISIKDASKKVKVNYSTAKNFFQKIRSLKMQGAKTTKKEAKLSRLDQKIIKSQLSVLSKQIEINKPFQKRKGLPEISMLPDISFYLKKLKDNLGLNPPFHTYSFICLS